MTTQPAEAVGNEATAPAEDAASDPFMEIAEDVFGPDEDEEQDESTEEATEAEAEDEPSDEDDEPEELPAIAPPNSLTAEEKEAFKNLPREAQEFTARRIGELEKGFQSKAQEAAQARDAARAEALQIAAQIEAEAHSRLSQYAKMLEVRPPDAALFRSNPEAYAQQLEAHQFYTAQREQAQREAGEAQARQAQYQAASQQHEAEQFRQRLRVELPEAFDEASGPKFIEELAATAKVLGYDDNAISQASVEELKALKAVGEWKAKAEKLDKYEARKMERVRAGKNPPPIARPGVARGPEQGRRARADQAWEAAKTAKSRPAKDQALASWMENTGWLD